MRNIVKYVVWKNPCLSTKRGMLKRFLNFIDSCVDTLEK